MTRPPSDAELVAGGTVLVVDDSLLLRMTAKKLLALDGHETLLADDVASARALFEEHQDVIDAVILDVHLPDANGFELLRSLRALPGGRDIPMIFLTGSDGGETHEQALDAGADDFLLKPIQATEIRLRVRSLIRRKRLAQERRQHIETIRALDAAKEELTALLVHDLKHPLSAILGFAKLIAEDGQSASAPMAEKIVENAELLHRMILDLLDIRRSEEGALRATLQTVDLGDLVLRAAAAAEGGARRRGRGITVALPSEKIPARVDPDLVERVLANLIDNALRHTPRSTNVHLEVLAGPPVAVAVSDEGPGIPEAQRHRVFEKYAQLDVNLRMSGEYTRVSRGLGLTFCHAAALAHGGSIRVEDREPHGARFVVELERGEPAN